MTGKEITEEMKKACYESYLGDLEYEWGTTKWAVTFEEFCEEYEEYGYELI